MKDYRTFLETYGNVNESIRHGLNGSCRLNLIHMQDARRHLKSTEVIAYASLLYAMNLLSQVVIAHFGPSIDLRLDSEKDRLFPEIYGILSTANMHVCPAVPAAIVIYCAMEEFDSKSSPWCHALEKQVWNEHIDEFDAAVNWVSNNLREMLLSLLDNAIEDSKINQIAHRYLEEHQKIKVEIQKTPSESQRITNF